MSNLSYYLCLHIENKWEKNSIQVCFCFRIYSLHKSPTQQSWIWSWLSVMGKLFVISFSVRPWWFLVSGAGFYLSCCVFAWNLLTKHWREKKKIPPTIATKRSNLIEFELFCLVCDTIHNSDLSFSTKKSFSFFPFLIYFSFFIAANNIVSIVNEKRTLLRQNSLITLAMHDIRNIFELMRGGYTKFASIKNIRHTNQPTAFCYIFLFRPTTKRIKEAKTQNVLNVSLFYSVSVAFQSIFWFRALKLY